MCTALRRVAATQIPETLTDPFSLYTAAATRTRSRMHQLGRIFSQSIMSRTNSSLPAQRENETAATRVDERTPLVGHGIRDTIKNSTKTTADGYAGP